MNFQEGIKISRISPESALEYLSVEEDVLNSPVYYFTLTPSTRGKGWESVTYYTNRSKGLTSTPSVDKQYVYVLSNPSMPGLLKVGYSKNNPHKRVKQLDRSTSIPTGFKVEWSYPCYNAIQLEGEVHKVLDSYRVNRGREFFRISLQEVKETVERLGEKYNY